MPSAEKQEDMRAWLTEEKDALSDAELWSDIKDHYTLKDLDNWLKQKTGKKAKVVKKAVGKEIVKKQAKVDISKGKGQAKSSGVGKQVQVKDSDKGKQKEIRPRVHRKKSTIG